MDDDEQYPADALSEEAELSAHGLRIEGEDDDDKEVEEEIEEDDLI